MNYLYFSMKQTHSSKALESCLVKEFRLDENRMFNRIQDLAYALARTPDSRPVVLLHLDRNSVNQAMKLLYLLDKARVFIALESSDEALICETHRLHPRFLALLPDHLSALLAVLRHINGRSGT